MVPPEWSGLVSAVEPKARSRSGKCVSEQPGVALAQSTPIWKHSEIEARRTRTGRMIARPAEPPEPRNPEPRNRQRTVRNVTAVPTVAFSIHGRCILRPGREPMADDPKVRDDLVRRIHNELLDAVDEELELEVEDRVPPEEAHGRGHVDLDRPQYFRELFRLQRELVKLQDWVVHERRKLVVLFEGRDAAGKGGVIKRIVQRLNPRVCTVTALQAPNERERTQWYFQRYIAHLPAAGEIVLFDRSWYNRAGVERVMGFCTDAEYEDFFRTVPEFERMLVHSGITLLKYWFSITDAEQDLRFKLRIQDPLKQWKLSPMDLESRRRWEQYTKAKEIMLQRTHIPEARWWVVEAVDKKRARLNCIHHMLQQLPYREVPHEPVQLPSRIHHPDYSRGPLPKELFVPSVY